MRVAVLGAGAIGIAAAIGAIDRGHDVVVLERDSIGASLRTWGPTRFFSPLRMNIMPRMREILGDAMPDGEALLTGPEFADRVLVALSEREPLVGRIRIGQNVTAIGRRGLTRNDYARHPLRAERPFRLLCKNASGVESLVEADVVLDASGGLTVPRPIGAGGLPAVGESSLATAPMRTLGDLASAHDELRGRTVLLVGDGHSAANAIALLATIAESDPATRVVWAVRTANRRPCTEVVHDPLPERQHVVERANALAQNPPAWLRIERRAMIERVQQNGSLVSVDLTGDRKVEVDCIAAFTGYRPENAYLSELAVEVSPVTEGGARLERAVAAITDCLSLPAVKPEDLASGEPGYYFIGSRAYGRASGFLLQAGLVQLETILDVIAR